MSSVTFRKALGSYKNLQELAQKEEDAEDKRMETERRLSGDKKKTSATTATTVPIIPMHQGLIGLALLAISTLLAQLFASPFARERMGKVVLATLGMLAVDIAYTHPRCGKARWYLLHALANLVITLFAIPDLITTLQAPRYCFTGPYSLVPVYLIAAVHLYHMLAFKCNTGDYVHHLLFGGIICPMGIFFVTGPVQNTVAFFICGLPGGLDYFMLALVKLGRMNRFAEKKLNSRINVWMRSPGLLLSAFCLVIARFDEDVTADVVERIPAAVCIGGALLCFLNGQYYMQVVVGNTFITTRLDPVKGKTHAYNS